MFIFIAAMPSFVVHRGIVPRAGPRIGVMMQFPKDLGGDLEGGNDEERNERVDALKKMFYSSSDDEGQVPAQNLQTLGTFANLPCARWSMVFLPTQQVLLNVFQPQYVLMFESIMAGPRPWYYLHVLLPGGVENLANPEYALPGGAGGASAGGAESKAPLTGTLMEIVSIEKQPDARLAIIAQGLTRAVVVRGTQDLPYSRADVQLLPDAESLLAAACAASRWRKESGNELKGGEESSSGAGDSDRFTLAAVAAEEAVWRPYENAPASLTEGVSEPGMVRTPPAFCAFYPDAAQQSVQKAQTAVAEALAAMPTTPTAAADSPLVLSALLDTSAALAAFDDEAEAEAEDLSALLALETQTWLELDQFLRRIANMRDSNGNMPVPKQLLCLLPPEPAAPASGWPLEFVLGNIVTEIKSAERKRRSLASPAISYDPEPFVPLDPRYPPRRRAEKLSYSIWLVIREEGLDLQPLLDTMSTADRLRMALGRLRDLSERLPPED